MLFLTAFFARQGVSASPPSGFIASGGSGVPKDREGWGDLAGLAPSGYLASPDCSCRGLSILIFPFLPD